MQQLHISNADKVLIIAPHPDDECIGCGGIIASYPKQTDVWLLTDGRLGGNPQAEEQIAARRKKEFLNEMQIGGVNGYKYFGFRDRELTNHLNLLINEDLSNYSMIFIPNQNDTHPDHVAAFQMLKRAAKKQDIFAQIYQYEITAPMVAPNTFLDITSVVGKKNELISVHVSQLEMTDYCAMAKALNSFRACTMGKKDSYVEAYSRTSILEAENQRLIDMGKQIQKLEATLEDYKYWIQQSLLGKSLESQLEFLGYQNIAIYGAGRLGLDISLAVSRDPHLRVAYFIDKYLDCNHIHNIDVLRPNEIVNYEPVDAIIVTVRDEFEAVKEELLNYGSQNIVAFINVWQEG